MTADPTLHPDRRSWVESANAAGTDFPPQNLPLGMFRSARGTARPGIAIGDRLVDLVAAAEEELLPRPLGELVERCAADRGLNPLLARGRDTLATLRAAAAEMLDAATAAGERARAQARTLLLPAGDVELLVPARIGNYTDFYASLQHATNVGSMFRPDSPLLPNYKWVPIGYHGRASSIVPSGAPVRRPQGQSREGDAPAPTFGPSRRLDYELEVGVFIGAGNALGEPIAIDRAEAHIAGLCLVNDWSARDIQSWEYQPLGPFLAKSFATTVSPWIVTLDALAPFRVAAHSRDPSDPTPLPYLASDANAARGGIDITLEVSLASAEMRRAGMTPLCVSRGSFSSMYWTVEQLVTHHTSNGCNLQPGDLLASGTVSGATPESRGCLLERTWRGTEPLHLPSGETRRFLEDGDEVVLRGWCERAGARRIGFGECRGTIVP